MILDMQGRYDETGTYCMAQSIHCMVKLTVQKQSHESSGSKLFRTLAQRLYIHCHDVIYQAGVSHPSCYYFSYHTHKTMSQRTNYTFDRRTAKILVINLLILATVCGVQNSSCVFCFLSKDLQLKLFLL